MDMQINKLAILGKSDATITMILDNLESQGCFPQVIIVNNLGQAVEKTFVNQKFDCHIVNSITEVPEGWSYFLGVFSTVAKQKAAAGFGLAAAHFINIIHQSASLSSTAGIGTACLINSHVSVAAHAVLGNHVSVNRNASVGHHTVLHDFVTVNPGAHIAGNVSVGQGAQIGMGAVVIDSVSIGAGTIIGAGSVVTKDIPEGVVAFGNPCRVVKKNEV